MNPDNEICYPTARFACEKWLCTMTTETISQPRLANKCNGEAKEGVVNHWPKKKFGWKSWQLVWRAWPPPVHCLGLSLQEQRGVQQQLDSPSMATESHQSRDQTDLASIFLLTLKRRMGCISHPEMHILYMGDQKT